MRTFAMPAPIPWAAALRRDAKRALAAREAKKKPVKPGQSKPAATTAPGAT
jgi:hypothetical protein